MTAMCGYGGYCVRMPGHTGCHTACPSACTLDWDNYRTEQERNAETLEFLDFPTPRWADLLD